MWPKEYDTKAWGVVQPNKIDEHHDRVLLENIYEKIAMDMKTEGLSGMCHTFVLSIQGLMVISTLYFMWWK